MPKLKPVCLWRLRHKQNARFSWFEMISGADLGGRGNLNCPQARRSPTPAPGSRAAQPAGGNQGSDWLPIFLPASGSGCGLLSSWLRVTANFRSARGPNVRTAGAMTINDIAQARRRQAGHCTHLRKPEGLSETGATATAAKLPECWPGQQDVGRVPSSTAFLFRPAFLGFRLKNDYCSLRTAQSKNAAKSSLTCVNLRLV